MNTKTAKKLRKLAKSMATEPFAVKFLGNSKRFVIEAAPEPKTTELAGELLANPPVIKYLPGTAMVNPNSARGIYKQLKKAARQHRG